jgi:hypothetical protein
LLDMSKSAATVGTLIIRIATLWFGVAIGLITFAVLTRRLARQGKLDRSEKRDAGGEIAVGSDPAG